MPQSPPVHVFSGVPTHFRACCRDIQTRRVNAGYEYVGTKMAHFLRSDSPFTVEDDEWNALVDAFVALLDAGQDDAAIAWLVAHYPKCMALVPTRRRQQFLKGIREVHQQGEL